jgi:hypothetical protein
VAVVRPGSLLPDRTLACLRFEVYRVELWNSVDPPRPVYRILNAGGNGPRDCTEDRSRAGILLRGDIRWDNCSNVEYRSGYKQRYEHYCHRGAAMLPGRAMERLYDLMIVLGCRVFEPEKQP